ncbi:MAG: hypothetical protein ACKN94_04720, partial [Pirellulaceae bacterium]
MVDAPGWATNEDLHRLAAVATLLSRFISPVATIARWWIGLAGNSSIPPPYSFFLGPDGSWSMPYPD